MRILSDYHDYYDSVQVLGQDLGLLWVRKRRAVQCDKKTYPFPRCLGVDNEVRTHRYGPRLWRMRDFVVGFCGQVYGAVLLETDKEQRYCYGVDEADAFVRQHYDEEQFDAYAKGKWGRKTAWSSSHRRRHLTDFFGACGKASALAARHFADNNTPVFVGRGAKLTVTYDDSLKELGFVRVYDPYAAFQEISSFYGGLARPHKEIPTISDVDMVEIKGFDPKYSFRKPPREK